ncbi:MAG TPA: class I SAM-dependent methyltransferase [Chitinophagaceae bacterium]|nr:class I SAM-dependent methyltransferase [Chitinophagaceae bacterium]
MQQEHITFSFGQNWKDFLNTVGEAEIRKAIDDIKEWLGDDISEKRVIDVGCGSGIHSLAFSLMGVKELISFDYDLKSVQATQEMWERAGSPHNWKVLHGSILNKEFLIQLGKFDLVYSWGVLHHTGEMWNAIENAINLVDKSGSFLIAIYIKGPKYQKHLKTKRKYNRATPFVKKIMVWRYILSVIVYRLRTGKNPFSWNEKKERGMNVYNDIVDWLGGLPYEVAGREEIVKFFADRKLELQKISVAQSEGGCSTYLFHNLN